MSRYNFVEDCTMKQSINTMSDFNLRDELMKIVCALIHNDSNNQMMDTHTTETNIDVSTLNKNKRNNKSNKGGKLII